MKAVLCLLFGLVLVTASTSTATASTASGAASTAASSAVASGGGASSAASAGSASGASGSTSSAPAAPVCTDPLPASYSRNLRFTILVGCAGFLLVALVFFGMSCTASSNVIHVLAFLSMVTLGLGYLTLYEGIGSVYKAEDDECRLIFLGRFITLFFTLPVVVTAFTLYSRVEPSAIIGGAGAIMLTFFSWTLGALVTGPQKYVWWVVGTLFAVAEVVHLLAVSSAAKRSLTANGAAVANVAFIVFAGSLLGYAAIWVIGGTGTGYLNRSTEMMWYVLIDCVAHVAVGFALTTSGEAVLDGSFVPLLSDQGASFNQAYGSGAPSSFTPAAFPNAYESRQYV